MLMEGLVGIVALIAAASLARRLYYDINIDQTQGRGLAGEARPAVRSELRQARDRCTHLPARRSTGATWPSVERMVGGESLRGRTGGAVTLAVGMAFILTDALQLDRPARSKAMMKYWYHFAIMFEALFILTTIDTGTRIARFLLQEALGTVYPRFGKTDWLPGAVLATVVVTAGWGVPGVRRARSTRSGRCSASPTNCWR